MRIPNIFDFFGLLILLLPSLILAKPVLPDNAQFAVSLSYDDSLASQLEHAVPALNKHQFRASFYVFPASPTFAGRLEDWRALVQQGHELGNHTLYHGCDGRGADRAWVPPYAAVDQRTVAHMRSEVELANTLLQALDGTTERTFTAPCGDVLAKDGDYVAAVRELFVAIKGQGLADGSERLFLPNGASGKDLIEFLQSVDPSVTVISIIFHGVGGDHLSVTPEAHNQLLEFLAKNKHTYWVDSYINIMRLLKSAEKNP